MTPGTSRAGRVEIVLTVDGKEYRREINQAVSQMDGLEKKTALSAAAFSKLKTSLGAAFGAGAAAAVGKAVYDTARQFELLNAQLLTVERAEPRARLAFQRIQEFAASTPFQLQEVVQAFIDLRNRGLDPSAEALTAYGNIATSMGKSLDQVIEAVADAATGEMERLKEFGIVARKSGDQITFTFRGVSTTVRNNASDIEGYLRRLGNIDFAGGMQRQMDTLTGVSSNLGDAFAALALRIDSGTGFTGAIKSAMRWVTEIANQLAGVSRPIQAIEADIAALEARMAKLPGRGRASAARAPLQGDLEDLRAERLAAQSRSSSVKDLDAASAELERQIGAQRKAMEATVVRDDDGNAIVRRGKAVTTITREQTLALRELENQLAQVQARRTEIAKVDAEAAEPPAPAATPGSPSGGSRRKPFSDQLRDRELAIRLIGQEGEAAKVRAQIELGYYAELSKAERTRLLELAESEDLARKNFEAEQDRRREREKADKEEMRRAEEFFRETAPKTGGRDGIERIRDEVENRSRGDLDRVFRAVRAEERAGFEQQLVELERFREEGLQLGVDVDARAEQLKKAHLERMLALERAHQAAKDGLRQQELQVAADFFGNLATIAQAFGEKGFKAYKAFAIAQTLIQTYQNATQAFGSLVSIPYVGPVLATAAAGAAIAAGYANVQAIRAQQPPGRRFGGPVDPSKLYEVGEGDDPELLRANGRTYLIPGNEGGTVAPAKRASSSNQGMSSAPTVKFINNGAPVEQTAPPQWDGQTLTLFVDTAKAAVRKDIRRGVGIGSDMGSTYGLQRKQQRSLA